MLILPYLAGPHQVPRRSFFDCKLFSYTSLWYCGGINRVARRIYCNDQWSTLALAPDLLVCTMLRKTVVSNWLNLLTFNWFDICFSVLLSSHFVSIALLMVHIQDEPVLFLTIHKLNDLLHPTHLHGQFYFYIIVLANVLDTTLMYAWYGFTDFAYDDSMNRIDMLNCIIHSKIWLCRSRWS
jgi:hypothetical protein